MSFLAFDLLYAGGRSLLKEPYDKRRSLLDYLRHKDGDRYLALIAKLGLRK